MHTINPDSTVLNQLQEHWQQIAAVLVWKLARDGVVITHADLEAYARATAAGTAVLLTHGHKDSIELKIVSAERARAIAEYDATQRGSG